MDFFNSEFALGIIGKAAQADLTEYLIVVAVVWRVIVKKVGAHMSSIENSIKSMSGDMHGIKNEVKELREAVTKDMSIHSSRLSVVETQVSELGNRVSKLES